jgi:octaprenyl-diphosphate synthase
LESVADIKKFVDAEMVEFEIKFKQSMKSNVALLDRVTHYIIKRKGKQLRPMFVFISAKMFGQVQESTYVGASLIELLHTATLVHDDVVDDSFERRGFFSLNALWKNKIAVLVGDFLLSKGLILSVNHNEFDQLRIVTNAVQQMSEGELLQMEKARKLNITEEIYYEIIRQKTAVLLASCCACGAASQKQSKEIIEQMRLFGELTGMAFQIKDDLFDYGAGKDIGKPTGIDIRERKMTLPLIYTLNNVDRQTKRTIINIVKNENEDSKKVKEVIELVTKHGGIKYATEKMHEYKNKALEVIKPFPDNEAKKALEFLVNYTVEREK